MSGASVVFAPLLGWPVVGVLAALALAVTLLSLWRGLAGWAFRALGFALILAALANPSLQTEDRQALSDIALVLRDDTGSNRLAGRAAQTDAAAAHLTDELARLGIELRVVAVPDAPDNGGSQMNTALEAALADLPRDRLVGVFVVSDGIAHDPVGAAPPAPADPGADRPARRLGPSADRAQRAGLWHSGRNAAPDAADDDEGAVPDRLRGAPVRIGFALNGEDLRYASAPVGVDMGLDLTLDRGGLNVLRFVLAAEDGELTDRNNAAVVQINGIRDACGAGLGRAAHRAADLGATC